MGLTEEETERALAAMRAHDNKRAGDFLAKAIPGLRRGA
jgi:hypothetical protein